MEIVGLICIFVAVAIAIVYSIQLLILAFSESVLWGLCYLFVPFASLVFLVMYWDQTKSPFLKSLTAIPFFILGAALSSPNTATY